LRTIALEVLAGAKRAAHPPEEMPYRIQFCAKSFILQMYDVFASHKSLAAPKILLLPIHSYKKPPTAGCDGEDRRQPLVIQKNWSTFSRIALLTPCLSTVTQEDRGAEANLAITAIREGLSPTDADPTWEPWLDFFKPGAPAFPEYPSAHASISGSAAFVLAFIFGDNISFTVTSESRPGTRSFSSFSSAVAEIADARVFGGIHFRTSCDLGNTLGRAVANFVATHAMRPLE